MKKTTGFKLLVLLLTLSMLLSSVACGLVEEETGESEFGTSAEEETTTEGGDTTAKGDGATTEITSAASETETETDTETETETESETESDTESDTETDGETTEKKDGETTETDDGETTEKKDGEVEEKDPETPMDAFWGPVFFDKLADISGVEKSTETDEGGFEYTHFDVKTTQQDCHFYFSPLPKSGRYLFIKLRTNSSSNLEIYTSTEDGGAASSNNKVVNYKNNGEWQVLAFDLTETHPSAVVEKDGKYALRFLRLDLVNSTAAGKYVDVAFVALCDQLSDYKEFLGDTPCDHIIKTELQLKEGVGYVSTCRICNGNVGEPVPFRVCYTTQLNRGWKDDLISETTKDGVKITVNKEGGISGDYEATVGFSAAKIEGGRYAVVKYRAGDGYTGSFEIFANDLAESATIARVAKKNADGLSICEAYKLNPDPDANGAGKYLDKNGKGTDDKSQAATVNTAVDDGEALEPDCELKVDPATQDYVFVYQAMGAATTGSVATVVSDGEWHIFVIDLDAKLTPRLIKNGYEPDDYYLDPLTPAEDGSCSFKFLRLDIINGAKAPKGAWIEYAYIGFANTVEDVKAVVNIKEADCIHGASVTEFVKDENNHTSACPFCGKSSTAPHTASGEYLEGGAKNDATHIEACSVCGYEMSIAHTPNEGEGATPKDDGVSHYVKCKCGYEITDTCAAVGALTYDPDMRMYKGKCTCGRVSASYFRYYVDAFALGLESTDSSKVTFSKQYVAAEGDEPAYVRYTASATVNGVEGYTSNMVKGNKKATGQYLVIRMRTDRPHVQIYADTNGVGAGQGGDYMVVHPSPAIWSSTSWTVVVFDLSIIAKFRPTNGEYIAKTLRLDFFNNNSSTSGFFDIADMGLVDDLDVVAKYIEDNGGAALAHNHIAATGEYETDDAEHWTVCGICSAEIGGTRESHAIASVDGIVDNGDGTHSGLCVCGETYTEDCTPEGSAIPNEGEATHSFVCSVCDGEIVEPCADSGKLKYNETTKKYDSLCLCNNVAVAGKSSFLCEVDVNSITVYSTNESAVTFSKQEVAAEGGEPAHVHFTANAAASNIDGYTGNIVNGNTAPTGQYLVIKMRTNRPHVQIWSDTTGQGGDYMVVHPSPAIWSSTSWTVVVFDLSKISAYGAVDGVYTAKNLRIDLFNNDASTTSFFDIAYMGFVDNLGAVEEGYVQAE